MNTPFLRPRLATLFLSGCLLASAFPLNANADDRDERPGFLQRLFPPPPPRHVRRVKVIRVYGRPGMVPPGYTVVYPQGRAPVTSDTATYSSAYPETGLRMPAPAPAPDNGVVYSERSAMPSAQAQQSQPLQHMEIPADLAARREGRAADTTQYYSSQPREDESGITSVASSYNSRLGKPEQPLMNSSVAPLPDTAVKEAPKPAPKPELKNVPVATRSTHPGFVKSPFEPFNELDATGMYSGMLAKDPTTGKIFRMP